MRFFAGLVTIAVSNYEVLDMVKRTGWGDSAVRWTSDQSHYDAPCLYQGNCSGHGENVMGTCFCAPGYTGKHCKRPPKVPIQCTHKDDRCFYSAKTGVMAVSPSRWKYAQSAEAGLWRSGRRLSASSARSSRRWPGLPRERCGVSASSHGRLGAGDRTNEHLIDFEEYRPVGPDGTNLGTLLEVGTGPWTQSIAMMEARGFVADTCARIARLARVHV